MKLKKIAILLLLIAPTAHSADKLLIDEDFSIAEEAAIPLTADEIKLFRKTVIESGQAKNNTPLPLRSADTFYLEEMGAAGMTGKMVVHPGYSSTIAFVDQRGDPFPVVWYHAGNDESIRVSGEKSFNDKDESIDGLSNILVIDPIKNYLATNTVIHLKNLSIPITIDITSSLRIGGEPRYDNPTFVVPTVLNEEVAGAPPTRLIKDQLMLKLLDQTADNVIKHGNKWLESSSGSFLNEIAGELFSDKSNSNYLYLRTKNILVEPLAYDTVASSGMRVYKIKNVATIVMRDRRGSVVVFTKNN